MKKEVKNESEFIDLGLPSGNLWKEKAVCKWEWQGAGHNGNSVFLPAELIPMDSIYDLGSDGNYWSSTHCGSRTNLAWCLGFFPGRVYMHTGLRNYTKRSVRLIKNN